MHVIELNLHIACIQKPLHGKVPLGKLKSTILISSKYALWWCINLRNEVNGWFMPGSMVVSTVGGS